jgi:hypothetical protein
MTNEEKTAIEFYVSVLFQTIEELSETVRALRAMDNSKSSAVEFLRSVENYSDPQSESRHQAYTVLWSRAAQSLANRDLDEFGEVVRELRIKANQYQ